MQSTFSVTLPRVWICIAPLLGLFVSLRSCFESRRIYFVSRRSRFAPEGDVLNPEGFVLSPEGDVLNPEGFVLPDFWDICLPKELFCSPKGIEERHMDNTGLLH